ncbi:MAG TPA: CBS domain-containing protein [Rhodocyclaceae bacterium]|nr:CBS domain-containing protein [Rhodocyclaceae bacterium]
MTTIRQLLGDKPRAPLAVKPDDTILTALETMAKYDVGALLVMDGPRLVGIFSERDYARKVILHGKSSQEMRVREIMTEKVIYALPQQTVAEAMAIVTEKHIRHLPVLDGDGQVIGVVSIGDLVKETISQQQFVIKQLEHYIAG